MIKNIITSLILILLLAGCKKNLLDKNEYWNFEPNNAYVKLIHAYNSLYPSTATPANGAAVDYFINGTRVSGVNAAGAGTAYSGIFPTTSGQYISVPAGTVSIKTVMTRTTGTPLATDVISDGSYTLAAGSYYSAFLVDTLPFPGASNPTMVVLPDDAARAKAGYFKMRFAHMIPTTDTLEIFSKNSQTVMLGNITYKKATDFIELPLLSRNDTIQLRKKGTTAILAEQRPFLPVTEKVYTFICRGIYTATNGTRARTLTTYGNQ